MKINAGKLAEGYRVLDTILGRNKVRAQLRRAERHEKKGVKRRRLRSERWRKQFANEVSSFSLTLRFVYMYCNRSGRRLSW